MLLLLVLSSSIRQLLNAVRLGFDGLLIVVFLMLDLETRALQGEHLLVRIARLLPGLAHVERVLVRVQVVKPLTT